MALRTPSKTTLPRPATANDTPAFSRSSSITDDAVSLPRPSTAADPTARANFLSRFDSATASTISVSALGGSSVSSRFQVPLSIQTSASTSPSNFSPNGSLPRPQRSFQDTTVAMEQDRKSSNDSSMNKMISASSIVTDIYNSALGRMFLNSVNRTYKRNIKSTIANLQNLYLPLFMLIFILFY
jgi:hypothetical protein